MEQVFKGRFQITAEACIAAAVMLLCIPIRWLVGWVLAALCHESFHCLVLWIFGKRIDQIRIHWSGAQICTEDLSSWQMAVCALAGPVGSLLLLLPGWRFPEFSLCIVFQSAFNLLPFTSFDGGRALRGILDCLISPIGAGKICRVIENLLFAGLLLTGIWLMICWKQGILPLILFAAAVTKGVREKFLANGGFARYNSSTKIEEVRL